MRSPSERILDSERRSLSAIAAIALGERAAFIVQEINHWTKHYKDKRDKDHFHQGFYWIWNSYKQWRKAFPFIPEPSLKKVILDLERKNILISAEFNRNRGDRTKWYRVNYNVLDKLIIEAEVEYEKIMSDPSDLIDPMPLDPIDPKVGCERSEGGCERSEGGCERSTLSTDLSIDLSIDQTTKKEKETDFVFPEIRDLKNEALDEENINSSGKAKNQEDPIPPTPLSHAPEKIVKPLPPDPMGDRFRSKTNNRWQKVMSDRPEWQEVLTEWASSTDCKFGFKQSLLKAQIAHLKEWKLPCEVGNAMSSLSGYIKNNDLESFELRVDAAIAIEETDRRLEAMQITKPECTTTYWYLWGANANEEAIYWIVKPQSKDALEEERKDQQIAVLDKLLKKLSDRGLLHLAIEGKHKLHSNYMTAANLTLFPKMIADLGLYLQIQAQNYQGVAA